LQPALEKRIAPFGILGPSWEPHKSAHANLLWTWAYTLNVSVALHMQKCAYHWPHQHHQELTMWYMTVNEYILFSARGTVWH